MVQKTIRKVRIPKQEQKRYKDAMKRIGILISKQYGTIKEFLKIAGIPEGSYKRHVKMNMYEDVYFLNRLIMSFYSRYNSDRELIDLTDLFDKYRLIKKKYKSIRGFYLAHGRHLGLSHQKMIDIFGCKHVYHDRNSKTLFNYINRYEQQK